MYQVGDKVVYPVHGAGEVVAIEKKEVAGKTQDYYILRLPFSGMTVAVPMTETGRLGLRSLMNDEEVGRVLAILGGETEVKELPKKWNNRSKLLVDKIKAGNACELAVVVRNLADRERGLAAGERRLFEQAREILLSELKLVEVKGKVGERLGNVVGELERMG